MRGCAAPFEQSGNAENKGAGTHRRYVLRRARLQPHKFYRLRIPHRLDNTGAAAGDANQVEARTVLKGMCRYETEATVAWDRSGGFGDDMHRRSRQSCENLLRTCEVELG